VNHITTYLYDNKVAIQILDTAVTVMAAKTRDRVVYSRPIKIYQGIDNTITLEVKNQDQKPVNLTGMTVVAQVQDPAGQTPVTSITATVISVARGQASIVIPQTVVDTLTQRFYKILVKVTSSGQTRPAYIDQNYSVALDLEVLPGYQA
jgi:hypothetical protein